MKEKESRRQSRRVLLYEGGGDRSKIRNRRCQRGEDPGEVVKRSEGDVIRTIGPVRLNAGFGYGIGSRPPDRGRM